MHPLLRQNNNLWGDIVDIGDGLAPSLFVFVCKGDAHNVPLQFADSI
jgi:hypothetical protein